MWGLVRGSLPPPAPKLQARYPWGLGLGLLQGGGVATQLQAPSRSWCSSGAALPVTSGQEALWPCALCSQERSGAGRAGFLQPLASWEPGGHAVCSSQPPLACIPGSQGPCSARLEAAGLGAPCLVMAAPGLQRGSQVQRSSLPGILQPDSRATPSAVPLQGSVSS